MEHMTGSPWPSHGQTNRNQGYRDTGIYGCLGADHQGRKNHDSYNKLTTTVSAWCTVSVKTDLMVYLYHHRKFGIHLKRCIFTTFVHAFFVCAYYLSIYKYRFRIVSIAYVFIATQFVTVFFRGKFSVKEYHFFMSPILSRGGVHWAHNLGVVRHLYNESLLG